MGASIMQLLANYDPSGFVLDNQKKAMDLEGTRAEIARSRAATTQLGAATQGQLLDNQEKLKNLRDQQILGEALRQAGGDPSKAIPLAMKSGMSPTALGNFQKTHMEYQKGLGQLDEARLKREKEMNDLRGQVYAGLLEMPDDQRAAAASAAAARLQQIDPAHPTDPQRLIDPAYLQQQIGFTGFQDTMIKRAKGRADIEHVTAQTRQAEALTAKEQAQTANLIAEKPGVEAEAAAKQRQNIAVQLAGAKDQQQYETMLNELPYGIAKQFGEKFDKAKILALGQTPQQQVQADQAKLDSDRRERHELVEEGQGAQRVKYEGQRVGIAGAELDLKRKQFNATIGAGLDANGRPLPPDDAKRLAEQDPMAKAIANYQAPPVAASRGQISPIMRKVLAINPEYNAQNWQAKGTVLKDFSSGSRSKQLEALGTTMAHLTELDRAATALQNGNLQVLNSIAQKYGVATGQDAATTFGTIVRRVGPEVANSYVQGGGGQEERQAIMHDFSASMSPQQLHSNVKVTAKLLNGKVGAMRQTWKNTMGDKPMPNISPEAEDTLRRLSSEGGAATAHKVGDTVLYGGKPHRITEVKPNGKLVLEP